MFNDGIIEDARSFVRNILNNRFQSKEELLEVEDVLYKEFLTRKKAAQDDNRKGDNLSEFLFFQGMIVGMNIAYREVQIRLRNEAWKQGVSLDTGAPIKGHGNGPIGS